MPIQVIRLDEELGKLAKGKKTMFPARHVVKSVSEIFSRHCRAYDEARKGSAVVLEEGTGRDAVNITFSARLGSQPAHGQCGVCVTELCNNCGGLKRQGKPCRMCRTITAIS